MPDKRTIIIIARDIYKSSSYYRAVKAKEVIAFDLFVVNVSVARWLPVFPGGSSSSGRGEMETRLALAQIVFTRRFFLFPTSAKVFDISAHPPPQFLIIGFFSSSSSLAAKISLWSSADIRRAIVWGYPRHYRGFLTLHSGLCAIRNR